MEAWPSLLKGIAYLVALIVLAVVGYRLARRLGRSVLVGLLSALGVTVVMLTPVWWPHVFLPLPKDEVMIVHFHANRADIESVVRRYREFVPAPKEDASTAWNRPAEVKMMIDRDEIDRVTYVGPVWLPDPYSVETAKRVRELIRHAIDFSLSRRYGSIKVDLQPHSDYWQELIGLEGPIWKDLRYFPEVPRIQNGRLVYPPDEHGRAERSVRVLDSLNSYPPAWKHGQCFMRRIEAQWFISMCMGTW